MASLAPSTWNTLGLGVAAAYATLGTASFLHPSLVAQQLGFRSIAISSDDGADLMAFIGARDLSFSLAIVALSREGRYKEMGTVILSTMLFCAVDLGILWKNGQRLETALGAAVVSGAGFVGAKLSRGFI